MELNQEIFKKFLNNQCTQAEAEAVAAYLKEHPDELERYMPLDDWLSDDKKPLNMEVSERMLHQIREGYEPARRTVTTRLLVRWAVAASLAGVVVMTANKLYTRKNGPETVATVAAAEATGRAMEAKRVENNTKQAMRISLPDSSIVVLYPGSSLEYLPAFEEDRRDLYLKGKAQFKVASIPSKPFTVYAEGIATTVLGTIFRVTEQPNKKVSVMLVEGKVRVWSRHKEDGNRSILLDPGDEVAVTGGQFGSYALVHNASRHGNNALANTASAGTGDYDGSANDLVFKNERVKDVFKKIEERFGVTIDDEKAKGIRERLFTGRFLETDSIEFVARTICNFYDLHYRIEGNIVTITAN